MALTANKGRKIIASGPDAYASYGVKAASRIFQGSLVGEDSSTGNARALVAGDTFLGINEFDEQDNSGGLVNAKRAKVCTQGVWQLDMAITGASNGDADIGSDVYASDDGTLTLTSTSNTKIGKIIDRNPVSGYFHVFFISDYRIVS